jgi:Spy/CpxP family protein refolding chaperone
MNVRTKSGFLLALTLVIGVLLGLIVDRSYMKWRIEKQFMRMQSPDGLARMIERIIDPSESQYAQVMQILDRRSKQLHDINEKSRQNVLAIMDSLDVELGAVLTPEQKQQLNRHIERMKHFRNRPFPPGKDWGPRGPRGPHPPEDDDMPPPPPMPPPDHPF